MIITIVMDQYGSPSNGTTVTAMRFADTLREHGHTVRIVTSVNIDDNDAYIVPKREYPFIMKLIRSQGMELAKPDKEVLRRAIAGADIVHFFLPFKLAKAGKQVADELGVASIAAFHLQPENITYSIKMNKLTFVHHILYRKFRKFFDMFGHVHCPSMMLKDILDGYGYKAQKHVLSNGVLAHFAPIETIRPPEYEGKFLVLMCGRLSREKRQDLIIKAVAKSKYADNIRVIFCGKGPWQKELEKIAAKHLPYKAEFKFCNREDLIRTINMCDLYVHASEVELEAISCMEAFSCGLVPVISDSKMSATKQFALTEHNLFKMGDVDDLVSKIDYYYENRQELARMKDEYLKYAANFRLDRCVSQMEDIYADVIAEHNSTHNVEQVNK